MLQWIKIVRNSYSNTIDDRKLILINFQCQCETIFDAIRNVKPDDGLHFRLYYASNYLVHQLKRVLYLSDSPCSIP